jgi:filamentous hemagglutinin
LRVLKIVVVCELSQTGAAIVGRSVTIDAVVGTTDTRQIYKKQSAGITLGLSGGVVSAAEAAYGASKRGSEVKDDRLKALYAAQAAYAVSDGYQAATAAGTSGDAGVSLRIGIGASSASSETRTHDETAYGSRIHSNGDIAIAATGGDLNIIGSQVDGTNVALAAANNINLLSQEELHSSKSTNRNGSGEIGFSIGSQTGFYVTASAGRGKGTGNGVTHAETTIGASDTLTLVSGNDTTIKGAQLTGNQVIAAIGGNLRVESEQDTDDYASKQQQVGGTFVYGYGGSASYNQDKINSHYTSVNEVSGISAGDGGFQIAVGGNTHLKGGVIASDADPSRNLLNTGSLTWEAIHNEANYSASGVGLSGGYSSGKAGSDGTPNPFGKEGYGASPSMSFPQKGHSSSETLAGIASSTIVVRDGPVDLSGLDRTPSLDSQALKGIFDEQKIRERLELGRVAGQVGFRAAGDLAGQMGWAEGSKERTVLHGVVGAAVTGLGGGNALQGGLGAAANQYAIPAMAQNLADQGYDPRSPEFSSMLELGSTALGAALGGGAGAATALDGTRYNYLKHNELRQVKKDLQNCLTRGGDVSACQGQVLVDAKLLSQANDIALYLACTGDSGCKASDIGTATKYAVDPTVPTGLNEDQARGTGILLTSLFSNDDGYKFYPELSDREAFFQALQNGTELKGGQTVWPQVAAQTSDSLQDVNSVICLFRAKGTRAKGTGVVKSRFLSELTAPVPFCCHDQFSTTFTDGTDTAQARADAKAFLYQHWATNPDGTQAYSMAVSDAEFVNGNLGIATLLKDPEAYKYVQQALNPGGDPAIAAALEDYYTQQNKKDPQTIAAIDAYVRQQTNKDAMLLLSFAAPGLASTVEIGGKLWQGDYKGAGKQAATDALISAATFGVGKAVGVGFGVLKTAIKEGKAADKVAVAVGEAAKDAAKAVGSEASEVAAKQAVSTQNAIGFAPGVAEAATLGMRSGGGHAIRHLEGNLIPSTGSLQSRVEAFKSIVIPILKEPLHVTDWTIGATQGRAFLGKVGGQNLVVIVAKDGPQQGKVISSFIPDEKQLAIMTSR